MDCHLQAWQYLAEWYFKLQAERKELSVPGTAQLDQVEVLFDKEDVANVRNQKNVMQLKRGVPSIGVRPVAQAHPFSFIRRLQKF